MSINELWTERKKIGKSSISSKLDEYKDSENRFTAMSDDNDIEIVHETNEYEKPCDEKNILLIVISQIKSILMMQTDLHYF